jgi:hypothetical protein
MEAMGPHLRNKAAQASGTIMQRQLTLKSPKSNDWGEYES